MVIHSRYRNPCLHRQMSPYTIVTGKPCDWSKLRVFGSSVVEHIPNDPERKTVGVPVGRHRIFVGFKTYSSGYLLFDPTSRTFETADSCTFIEDFSDRIDSLRPGGVDSTGPRVPGCVRSVPDFSPPQAKIFFEERILRKF